MLSPSGTSIKRVFSFGRNKLEKEKPEHPRRKKPTKHVAAIEEEDEGEEEAEGGGGVEEKEASKNNNVNSSQQQVFPSNKDNKNNIATVTVGTKALVEKFNGTR
jgi:hypothetical protein